MCAELGALGGVHAPLEEGAEDRGVHRRPVELAREPDALDLGVFEFEDLDVLEQVAVEVLDAPDAEAAAGGHLVEEFLDGGGELLGLVAVLAENLGQRAVGQQAHVLGEEAEDHAVEKACDLVGVEAAAAKAVGDLGEALGGLPRDALAGHAGLQLARVVEDGPHDLKVVGLLEVEQADVVDLGHRRGEVGVDHDAVHVAHAQERGVAEGFAVSEELVVGGFEVLVLAFVLEGEEVLLPHVGPAVAAAVLGGAALEREPFALGIGVGRLGVVEQLAQVEEVLLRAGALREVRLLPLDEETGDVHAWRLPRRRQRTECSGKSRWSQARMPTPGGESWHSWWHSWPPPPPRRLEKRVLCASAPALWVPGRPRMSKKQRPNVQKESLCAGGSA